jgi:DNA-binding FadR family transcriptional regulator
MNKCLISFALNVLEHLSRFAFTTVNDQERLEISYRQHKAIYEAIESGSPDKAEETMRQHIRDVRLYQTKRHFML